MHGSVCLFSKYLQHLFEGENKNELDISSAGSTDNIFSGKTTLSTGWTGTCPVLKLFNSVQNDFNSQITSLNTILSTTHLNTKSSYESTNDLMSKIFETSTITGTLGETVTFTPNFEREFSDKTNTSLLGGQIQSDFNKLKNYIEEQNTNIETKINNLINNNAFKSSIDLAYTNFVNFDTAVATASNIMNNRMLDLKDYFLTLQFLLMFFTWGYLLFFVAAIVLYIIYACKEYQVVYYIIIVVINIIFVIILVEIFLSSFFGQVRLICHEIPRAINFIFTGSYMVSGNSASYPAQFGRGDANMTNMFTNCLSGSGDLSSLFITSNDLSSLTSVQNDVSNLYTKINRTIYGSNLILNDYNSIQNSAFLKGINKLELMKYNLYLASEGFENNNIIHNIISNIRNYLDSSNCSMNNEYYVINETDCPSGSKISTTIDLTSGTHCYVMQNFQSSASYTGDCHNDYINNAINFIKNIDSSLDIRLTKLKTLQESYSNTFRNLSSEVYSTSQALNNSYSLLNSDLLLSSNITNCGSSRFDLIDFCDFIGDTTEYDARIVVIFSAFIGVFGFDLLYSFLVVLNGFGERDTIDDYDDYGYNYGKKGKIRNINIKVNKPKKSRESSDYDEEEEEEDNKKSFKRQRGKTPPKSAQKVEMSYMTKNNEDSDSD